MERNKPISLIDIHKALLLRQQQSNVATSEKLAPKGRGAKYLERLRSLTTNGKTTDYNKTVYSSNTYIGCSGLQRSVISNGIPITSEPVFQYSVKFSPDVESETSRAAFMKKCFAGNAFLYHESYVYTPTQLPSNGLQHSLPNRALGKLVTMTLTFQQKQNLQSCPKLFDKLMRLIDLNVIYCKQPGQEIVRSYVHSLRQCKAGQMLCVDCRYYLVQSKNVAEVVLDYQRLYADKYCMALNLFIKQFCVYNKLDNKIYEVCKIVWENESLRLKKDELQHSNVAFEYCHMSEIAHNLKSESSIELMSSIEQLIASEQLHPWNLQFSSLLKANARVLPPETILFGDGVTCSPKGGSWRAKMLENEVVTAIEIWCWIILYTPGNDRLAKQLGQKILEFQADTGINIGKPLYFPIASDSKRGYIEALNAVIDGNIQLLVVLTPQSENKPETLIKHICCVQKPVPCQIIAAADVDQPRKVQEIVLAMNAMLGATLWSVSFPCKSWMICGIGIHLGAETNPIGSFVASFTDDASQWYSKAVFLEREFAFHLKKWLVDTLKKYRSTNGDYPTNIVIYHNCTEETKSQICNNYKKFQVEQCLEELSIDSLKMCVILVQRDVNTCYYKNLEKGYANVPSGTVVDDVITNANSRDFFLVSHQAADNEIARPTYYNIIKDTCDLTPDVIQTLTYKLCHLYYKHAWVAEVPAPCKYAEHLGTLISEKTHRISSPVLDEYLYYL